jgi:hypothetical protein
MGQGRCVHLRVLRGAGGGGGLDAVGEEKANMLPYLALMTSIQVEAVSPAVRHEVTVKQIRQWLNSNCTSPRERVMKERLKGLIA